MVTRRPLVRIAGKTRQLPDGDQLALPVGPSPQQIPAGGYLGQLAFADSLGWLNALRHEPDVQAGALYWRYLSDSNVTMRLCGLDGVVRDISIVGPQGPKGDTGATGTFDSGQVGSDPSQVPSVAFLGAAAFEDFPGLTLVYQHAPDAPRNAVWRERVSDTETVLKYRGSDGVTRTRQELWT